MFASVKEKDFYHPFIIWLLIVLWYLILVYNFFDTPRLKTQDFISTGAFYIFLRPPPETKEVIIVAIDEASRRQLNLKWPWPRSLMARLIRNLSSFSPKVIGLDIIFSGKSDESQDQELASAFKAHPHIILAYRLEGEARELPLPNFVEATKGMGFVDKPLRKSRVLGIERGVDEVIRDLRSFYIDKDGEINFSFELELIADYLDIPRREIKIDRDRGIFLGDKLFIPAKRGITPLNYLAHYNEFQSFGASLVLEKKIDPDVFKEKIVLVGATDPLIHDQHLTPLGLFSGVSILGNSLVMLLSKRFIYELSVWQNLLLIFILGTLILFINKKLPFSLSSIFSFSLLSLVFGVSLYLRSRDIQFDYFSVFFLSIIAYATSNIYKYSYLMYMRNKLKNLAIKDPLTDFYTLRYFSLKLNEELKDKSKSLAFLALVIANYRRLSLDLTFETLKSLLKLLAENIKSAMEKGFKRVDFARISADIIGIAIREEPKGKIEEAFKVLLTKLKQLELKIEEEKPSLTLQGILIYKPPGKRAQTEDLLYSMETGLKILRKHPEKDYTDLDLTEEIWEKEAPIREDILDFLVSDLEERNKELEKTLKELLESRKETEEAYLEVISSLIKALEEKDTFTQGHTERVANYARAIAREIGLSDEESEQIYKAALLHDIGKIGLPDYLLHKREKLSAEELNLIRKHQTISTEILKPIKAFKNLLPIILHHHEHLDGTGYPYGLSGDMIPRGAQILAVADAFDAITSGRGYKKGRSSAAAITELKKHKEHFNLLYVKALQKVLHI